MLCFGLYHLHVILSSSYIWFKPLNRCVNINFVITVLVFALFVGIFLPFLACVQRLFSLSLSILSFLFRIMRNTLILSITRRMEDAKHSLTSACCPVKCSRMFRLYTIKKLLLFFRVCRIVLLTTVSLVLLLLRWRAVACERHARIENCFADCVIRTLLKEKVFCYMPYAVSAAR